MKIHPLLQDPCAVFIARYPLPSEVGWQDYHRAALQALAAMQVELENEKAVLKPNVTSGERFANPDSGVGTHPGFVHGMLDYLRQHGARKSGITIVEDPRDTDDNHPRHWHGTGYDQLSRDSGVRLHCPTTYTCVKKTVPEALVFPRLNVSRLAVAPGTVLFNIPKLKTHNLAITTLGLKNLMGLVNVFDRHYCAQAWQELPEQARTEKRPRQEWMNWAMHETWQTRLAYRLVDTARVLQPGLNVVEGIIGREGTGFQRGRNRPLGLIVAGVNVVAVDSLASYLMGFDPLRLIYLQIAAQNGLGTNDISQLRVFTDRGGSLIPCNELASWRATPPFRVITWVKGEEVSPFEQEDSSTRDASDVVMTNHMFRKEKI
jgi:uncharacterized protein (DUF362 family)